MLQDELSPPLLRPSTRDFMGEPPEMHSDSRFSWQRGQTLLDEYGVGYHRHYSSPRPGTSWGVPPEMHSDYSRFSWQRDQPIFHTYFEEEEEDCDLVEDEYEVGYRCHLLEPSTSANFMGSTTRLPEMQSDSRFSWQREGPIFQTHFKDEEDYDEAGGTSWGSPPDQMFHTDFAPMFQRERWRRTRTWEDEEEEVYPVVSAMKTLWAAQCGQSHPEF